MLYEIESSKSLDQIGKDLEEAASRHKFGVLTVHDLQEKLREKGVEMDRQVRIFEVCNPQQAKEVLDADPSVSTALPCRIAVYSDGAGCKLATMRPTELMKAFSGSGIDAVARQVEDSMVAIM
jgi:uncharacterized protein (DUF302 family)